MVSRRKYLGMTQQDVADLAGMTRSNYAHIERGRHNPSIDQMKSISKALKVKVDVNFFDKDCDEMYRCGDSEQKPA
ncbi:helix-turn-helix transcriptional regulator [Brevibacillus sp. MER 51]|uniref:helix-turn-helix transcriptional regulator n=1 Tax=Brevibacillus sp. MER 51 TaxID=2939560 RepID=UPI0025598510|nr:helix-turn-helix transcriptional regulator [Brevibacillus sp. MER 51]